MFLDKKKVMIILYDGVCLLCNRFVQFLVRRTKPSDCRFAPLQEVPHLASRKDSVWVLTQEGKWISESDAVLYIVQTLPYWGWIRIGKLIPAPWRDKIYRWIAQNRYGWFGQSPTCLFPEPGRMVSSDELQALRNLGSEHYL